MKFTPIIKFVSIIALFFASWISLSQINWVEILRIKQAGQTTEEHLGELIWHVLDKTERVVKNKKVTAPIDSIINRLCEKNQIDRSQIKVHIVDKKEVNAFALPNKYLVLHTGLILSADTEAELAGVLAHEIAHMEHDHVMKKLIKEIGLSVLTSITLGENAGVLIKEILALLSSSAYDRALEEEADRTAVRYLETAEIDPKPFANFFYKLAKNEHEIQSYTSWISTHPSSKKRAEYVLDLIDYNKTIFSPILTEEEWTSLKEYIREYQAY